MINRDEIIENLASYLGGEPISLDEYADRDDAPYSVIQIKRVIGSWDRAMYLVSETKTIEADIAAKTSPAKNPAVKQVDPKKDAVTK